MLSHFFSTYSLFTSQQNFLRRSMFFISRAKFVFVYQKVKNAIFAN